MFRLVRLCMMLALIGCAAYLGATVPLGEETLFGHFSRIWRSDETQDLVRGARETAGPAVARFKRGVEAAGADGETEVTTTLDASEAVEIARE